MTFECINQNFMVLPPGEGNLTIENVTMILKTNGTSYINMEITMRRGINIMVSVKFLICISMNFLICVNTISIALSNNKNFDFKKRL